MTNQKYLYEYIVFPEKGLIHTDIFLYEKGGFGAFPNP
ncbi:hypothetical protein L323_20155 [Ruminiclostridium papyrosolvens C7]|uniref:Uncharacterized protein n=1 Tax=Ruminiclostridium papyrosolvens C7 TaxID=1330534 RepID=U4QWW1_9FIRM|nr:hypothetical protein L323_20155 [Ruminiclostridium papyrosolvens C7]